MHTTEINVFSAVIGFIIGTLFVAFLSVHIREKINYTHTAELLKRGYLVPVVNKETGVVENKWREDVKP